MGFVVNNNTPIYLYDNEAISGTESKRPNILTKDVPMLHGLGNSMDLGSQEPVFPGMVSPIYMEDIHVIKLVCFSPVNLLLWSGKNLEG